jgi:hypothetical protein
VGVEQVTGDYEVRRTARLSGPGCGGERVHHSPASIIERSSSLAAEDAWRVHVYISY